METLHFQITIDAPRQKVWHTMLDPEPYRQWSKGFSPDSQFSGDWVQGTHMIFFDPSLGGSKVLVEVVKPLERILVRNVAIVGKDMSEDTESETARQWIGVTEQYTFSDTAGGTRLDIDIQAPREFVQMFTSSWEAALPMLKALCESSA